MINLSDSLQVSSNSIDSVEADRNPGDPTFSAKTRTTSFYLRNITTVHPVIPMAAAETLIPLLFHPD